LRSKGKPYISFAEKTVEDEDASSKQFHQYMPDVKAVRKNLPRIDKSLLQHGLWGI
jgi:hypothetical protein